MFDGEELLDFIDQAQWVAVNDYEAQLLAGAHRVIASTSWPSASRPSSSRAGAKGSLIYTKEHRLEVPAAQAPCGGRPDRLRRRLPRRTALWPDERHGLADHRPLASLMGAIKIEHHGTQNHRFTREEFEQRFHDSFGYRL